ncbi:uncharacterized protein LOC119301262 isoform X2 [Triticum dicoccoides]|uniref:uncharacterized protein LOC119301262 isoform X2 n=1 Tax=Triticum dicoccoides TaxID=85692 RepID=UPI00188FAC76|nr:uncharacterized protein LOC119301262 isoform X2 [Triticum dicoccoides]
MPINKIEEVMLSDESEDGFIRSFVFYFISSILCPASYCFGNTKFLFSLRDVSVIPSLDFGQLALGFMIEESERHFEIIMNRPTLEEMNKPSHIGGCLPIWGIIYLDFVDFDVIENHQSTIDYSLPRISHIKNADFQYLALVDRNYESRKAFGVLPIRHISQTPYANAVPIGNIADTQQEICCIPKTQVNFHSNAHETINENNPINLTTPDIKSAGTSFTPKHEIDCKVKPELHSKLETPDVLVTKQDPVAPKAENNVKEELDPITEINQRSLVLISSSLSNERAKHYSSTPIIIDDSPFTPCAPTSEERPFGEANSNTGIYIDMGVALQSGSSRTNDAQAGSSTGPNTIEKKNRKKRAAKVQYPDEPKRLKIPREVDLFFTKFLRKPIFKEYTLFVNIEGFPISYDNFFASFKSRGEIGDEVMDSLIQTFNLEAKTSCQIKPFIKKFCFTSRFTNKLLVSPEVFDPVSCKTEFDRVNSEESLWKKDLLFFPTIKSNHWVIVCMNSLFERTHLFDPCGTIQENSQQQIVHNLVSNYNLLCKLSNKLFKNVFNFKLQAVGHYRTNCLMHDSGHYLPLYMDNFEGKVMKSFSTENVPKQRMISAYRLFKSTPNKIKEEDLPTSQ